MTHTKGFLFVDMPMIVVGSVLILVAAFCAPMASAQNPINQYIIGYYVRGATARSSHECRIRRAQRDRILRIARKVRP